MRVVYFVSLFPCWSETFIVREMKALIEQGVDVRIVSLRPHSESLVQDDAKALLDRVIYPPSLGVQVVRGVWELLRSPWAVSRLLMQLVVGLWRKPVELAKSLVSILRTLALLPTLRELEPDRLHAHWATYPSTSALLAARVLHRRFSFTSHAHDIFLHNHLIAAKLAQADVAITISEFNRRWLIEHHGRSLTSAQTEGLKVVHCGVSMAQFGYQPPGPARVRRLVLAVGRLDSIKGFEHLVDACALLQRAGVDFECCIVGDGPLATALHAHAVRLGLDGRLRWAGVLPQPQVKQLLSEAAVFALPSVVTPKGDRDGIPVALMEAMALGLPVVSTRVSGIPELVEDGVTGKLVPPGDALALAEAIRLQLDNRDAAAAMAARARRRVEASFDIDVESRRLLGYFKVHSIAAGRMQHGAFA